MEASPETDHDLHVLNSFINSPCVTVNKSVLRTCPAMFTMVAPACVLPERQAQDRETVFTIAGLVCGNAFDPRHAFGLDLDRQSPKVG